jgi:hypothetical protein
VIPLLPHKRMKCANPHKADACAVWLFGSGVLIQVADLAGGPPAFRQAVRVLCVCLAER